MTGGHNSSVGLALGHKPTSSGNIHSPHPRPRVSGFAGFPLPASPFPAGRCVVCTAGRRTWEVGLRKEEAGRGLRDTLFQGTCFLAASPREGVLEILPTPPTAASLPSHVAPSPASCPAITNGALCSRTKNSLLTPTWAGACLPGAPLGLRRDGATSQEGKRRPPEEQVPGGRGGACLLVWG